MLNFDFLENDLGMFLHRILCMIFQERCFSSYILLTAQITLPNWIAFTSWDIGQDIAIVF